MLLCGWRTDTDKLLGDFATQAPVHCIPRFSRDFVALPAQPVDAFWVLIIKPSLTSSKATLKTTSGKRVLFSEQDPAFNVNLKALRVPQVTTWAYRLQYFRMSLGLSWTTFASAKPMKTCNGNVYFSTSLLASLVIEEYQLLLLGHPQCLLYGASNTQPSVAERAESPIPSKRFLNGLHAA